MPAYAIRSNERVALLGKTGSGKTFAAHQLTRSLPRLVALDPKGTLGAAQEWGLTDWNERIARDYARGKPARIRVLPPGPDDDPYTYWLPFLRWFYESGNGTLYIDEIYGVTPPGRQPSPELTAIYTRGRELGLGCFAASQRPSWVPLFMLSEAEWILTFRLLLEEDRRRMAAICGPALLEPVRDPYGYYLFNTQWDTPVYSRGIGQ